MATTIAGIALFTTAMLAAGVIIMPQYAWTARVEIGRDVEEWSPAPMEIAGAVLTANGMAGAVSTPTPTPAPKDWKPVD